MGLSYITDYTEQALGSIAPVPPFLIAQDADEPEWFTGPAWNRKLHTVPAPAWAQEAPTLAEARAEIDAALEAYFADPAPGHMLLIKAAAGVGKTFRAVHLAERLAAQGQRVLYAGPRHAFYQDILALTKRPDLWYEWLPRQAGDDGGKVETCRWPGECNAWIQKGYEGMDFCAGVCGWDYINKGCPYHAQKKRAEPVIFGQHAHVLAHPLQFHAVIGDESPVSAFMHEWVLQPGEIMPTGLDPMAQLAQILHTLVSLAVSTTDGKTALTGPALLRALGGADRVWEALAEFQFEAGAIALAPKIHRAEEATWAQPFHLPALVHLLRREAQAVMDGETSYLERVIVAKGKLLLLLRRPVSEKLPQHIVWLDATGEPRIYEALFQRPVEVVAAAPRLQGRVIQVWNRANGKGIILNQDDGAAAAQLRQQIEAIAEPYQKPAAITYQGLVQEGRVGTVKALHFYAARGTNALQDVDCLIVAGTPMPALDVLAKTARMIFADRMAAFNAQWSTAILPYNYTDPVDGLGRAYPVGGYWGDPDLTAVLWSMREAELIQAIHRARPIQRAVDIYLLSNIPLPEFHLRAGDLRTIRQVMGAPEGVNAFDWPTVLFVADLLLTEKGCVTQADLMDRMGLASKATASKYWHMLRDVAGWVEIPALVKPNAKGGRPVTGLLKPEGAL